MYLLIILTSIFFFVQIIFSTKFSNFIFTVFMLVFQIIYNKDSETQIMIFSAYVKYFEVFIVYVIIIITRYNIISKNFKCVCIAWFQIKKKRIIDGWTSLFSICQPRIFFTFLCSLDYNVRHIVIRVMMPLMGFQFVGKRRIYSGSFLNIYWLPCFGRCYLLVGIKQGHLIQNTKYS